MDMKGYTKLFNTILASTIWREDDKTRLVWITMLAMADKDGIVEASVPGLAVFAGVSVDDCSMALNKLMSPDTHSRSKEYDGRRIGEVEGGWKILNHAKYRAMSVSDERREYFAKKQAEHRIKKGKCQQMSKNVKDMSLTPYVSVSVPPLDSHSSTPITEEEFERPRHIPTREQIAKWLSETQKFVVEGSSPYTQEETDLAVLSLAERGWTVYGTDRPVADWRAALEKQIQHNRSFKERTSRGREGREESVIPPLPLPPEEANRLNRLNVIREGLCIGRYWIHPDDDIERERKLKAGEILWPHWQAPQDDIERERRLNAGIPLGSYEIPKGAKR